MFRCVCELMRSTFRICGEDVYIVQLIGHFGCFLIGNHALEYGRIALWIRTIAHVKLKWADFHIEWNSCYRQLLLLNMAFLQPKSFSIRYKWFFSQETTKFLQNRHMMQKKNRLSGFWHYSVWIISVFFLSSRTQERVTFTNCGYNSVHTRFFFLVFVFDDLNSWFAGLKPDFKSHFRNWQIFKTFKPEFHTITDATNNQQN